MSLLRFIFVAENGGCLCTGFPTFCWRLMIQDWQLGLGRASRAVLYVVVRQSPLNAARTDNQVWDTGSAIVPSWRNTNGDSRPIGQNTTVAATECSPSLILSV